MNAETRKKVIAAINSAEPFNNRAALDRLLKDYDEQQKRIAVLEDALRRIDILSRCVQSEDDRDDLAALLKRITARATANTGEAK